jgi:hypothetical protein
MLSGTMRDPGFSGQSFDGVTDSLWASPQHDGNPSLIGRIGLWRENERTIAVFLERATGDGGHLIPNSR